MKRPAFQFYPGDWRKDPELQSCSIIARGVWWEMLCLMHECRPYGHLAQGGKPMTDKAVANNIRVAVTVYRGALAELERHGVPSRTEDGTIYSRRMVRDERIRNVRAIAGKQGGNPHLLGNKDKQSAEFAKAESNHDPNLRPEQKPTPSASALSSSSPSGLAPVAVDNSAAPQQPENYGDTRPNGKRPKPPPGWRTNVDIAARFGQAIGCPAHSGESADAYVNRLEQFLQRAVH